MSDSECSAASNIDLIREQNLKERNAFVRERFFDKEILYKPYF